MAGVNCVHLLGRLGQDPELRYMPDGKAVCNLSVATSDEWKDKNTGEKKEKTEWHRIVIFGLQAAACGQYLSKGREVYLQGKLQTRSWEDKQTGQKRYTTEIVASTVQFIGPKSEQQPARPQPPQGGYPKQGYQQPQQQGFTQSGYGQSGGYQHPKTESDDSDIPFRGGG